MKKLIIVLMIVSMAALLFTGCLPSTNTAPVITSTPVLTGTIGTAYTYTVTATDADGDTLTYAVSGPTGMVISTAGVISGWAPAAAGTYAVVVTVSDGTDPVTQSFNIIVPSIGPEEITISVAGEYLETATGKTYVKGGSREITVTFPAAVDNPKVEVGTVEVPVFSLDNKVWKGNGLFTDDCDAVTITVSGVCEELCAAKSVVVDSGKPYAELKASVELCDCETGVALTITSDWSEEADCPPDEIGCCGDDCSGLASWNVKIYDKYPWDECCEEDPCIEPDAELDGTSCPISITKECIDAVFVPDEGGGHWVDFFDHTFYVIATLTDKVGNETTYYGEVITDPDSDTLVSFVELVLNPSTPECTCYAEDPAAANLVIGDCDGTPADTCWVEPLNPCPEVTLVPANPIVGQLVTITIDYTDAEKPDGAVAAYVGPSIKTLPLGIPEEAQELVLSDPVDDVYTATYIFGQAGTDYIYVVDGCASCTPCKTGVTVSPAVCPDIAIEGEVEYLEDMYVSADSHEITITFEVPTVGVRLFADDSDEIAEFGNIFVNMDAEEILLSTANGGLTYTGTWDFDGSCDLTWLTVLVGEGCCPVVCSRTVIVDGEGPYVGLEAAIDTCEIGTCPPYTDGHILTLNTLTGEDCLEPCCGDDCTELTNWTIEIFNYLDGYGEEVQPYDDCCARQDVPSCDIFDVVTGTGCNVSYETACIADTTWEKANYKVIVTLEDLVGNTTVYNGVLMIDTGTPFTANIYSVKEKDFEKDCQNWKKLEGKNILGEECKPPKPS